MLIGSEYIGEGLLGTGSIESSVNQITETDLAQAIGKQKRITVAQVTETNLAQTITLKPERFNTGWLIGIPTGKDSGSWVDPENVAGSDNLYSTLDNRDDIDIAIYLATDEGGTSNVLLELPSSEGITIVGGNLDTWGGFLAVGSVYVVICDVDRKNELSITFDISNIPINAIITGYKISIEGSERLDSPQTVAIDNVSLKVYYNVLVNSASEIDTSQPVGKQKRKAVTQVTEVETALAITVKFIRNISVAQITETDSAQAITRKKTKEVSQVVETETAQIIGKQKSKVIAQSSETDNANAVGKLKSKTIPQVTEIDIANTISSLKNKTISQASETDLALSITPKKLVNVTPVSETEIALPVSVRKLKTIAQVTEIDEANGFSLPAETIYGEVEKAIETDTALPFTAKKLVHITQVEEIEFSLQLNRVLKRCNIAQVQEVDEAKRIVYKKYSPDAISQDDLTTEINEYDTSSEVVNYETEGVFVEIVTSELLPYEVSSEIIQDIIESEVI